MPRFAIPVILSLFLCSALLTACAAEPTPTPIPTPTPAPTATPLPTPTPTPPAWLGAAEEYANLAEEVVKDTLADVDFAFAAFGDTERENHVRIREAEARWETAAARQKQYESELNDARRDINGPAAVEESASALNNAASQVHFDALDDLELIIGYAIYLADTEGRDADIKGFTEESQGSEALSAATLQFESALADFKAAIEQGKLSTQ